MVYMRVFAAVAWGIMASVMAINWHWDEPLPAVGQWMLAFAVVYVLCRLVAQASDAVEMAVIRRHRHLDRRPQI